MAGSCWWDLPDSAPPERGVLRRYNQQLADSTPAAFAELLHVPVIHASHCGESNTLDFPAENVYQTRKFVGSSQIISSKGTVISKRSFAEGEGIVSAIVNWNRKDKKSIHIETEKYWIPDLPVAYTKAWEKNNELGKAYYQRTALPYYKKTFENTKNGDKYEK